MATDKKVKKSIVGIKQRGAEKVARIPIKVEQPVELLRKPSWIRAKSPFHPNVKKTKGSFARTEVTYRL